MSFLGPKKLRDELPKIISADFYSEDRIENASYELSLGDEYYITSSKLGVGHLDDTHTQIVVQPGQFALLITKEQITLPSHLIAFISIKAGIKFRGLVNVSGFHVDPGFTGRLKFSVYNAGPSDIVLDRGEPYFLIWFSSLDEGVAKDDLYNGDHQNQNGISADDVMKLKGELASPNGLLKEIKDLKNSQSRNNWLLGILFTLLLGIAVKLYWDWSNYKKGFSDGYLYQTETKKVHDAIEKANIDSIVTARVKLLTPSYVSPRGKRTNAQSDGNN